MSRWLPSAERMKVLLLFVALVAVVSCHDSTAPQTFPPGLFTSVSAGQHHACGLDTLGRAWCWGANGEGELGVARGACVSSAGLECTERPAIVSQDLRFSSISAGNDYTCALTSAGAAYCWGSNLAGKLGAASPPTTQCSITVCSDAPLAVGGSFTFSQISAGFGATCAVTTSGVGKCWGSNNEALLGSATGLASATPVSLLLQPSGDSTWESVARGSSTNDCAITPGHQAVCWGDNVAGQVGVGLPLATSHTPILPSVVANGLTLHGVTVGSAFACALDAAGAAYCWGISTDSSLGVGLEPGGVGCTPGGTAVTCYAAPTKVGGGYHFSAVSAGGGHACGLTSIGDAYCWGLNSSQEIGTGAIPSQAIFVAFPFLVNGGLHFSAISAGGAFNCGLTTDKNVWCWGTNARGQLGQDPFDSTTTTFPITESGIPIRIIAH